MCIIVDQPEGHVFTPREIHDFYGRNRDGFGVMWAEDGRVRGLRFLPSSKEEAYTLYRRHAAGRACVLHYRMATSGPKDVRHAHPFEVSSDLLVVHNGVLGSGSDSESDTAQFVRLILRPMLDGQEDNLQEPLVREAIESLIYGSSLVFLDGEGTVTKLGSKGVEHRGCWYSNTYAWDAPAYLRPRMVASSGKGGWTWDDDDARPVRALPAKSASESASVFEATFADAEGDDDTDPRIHLEDVGDLRTFRSHYGFVDADDNADWE